MILTDEQEMIRDMGRQFAQNELAPNSAEWDRSHKFPKDAISEMGKLGMMGMLVPEEYDGSNVDMLSYALCLEEIAAGDGSCSTIMSVHNSVGCMPILKFGTEDQKQRFLKPLARGEMLAAFCLTEPQAGSDASDLKTTAVKKGDNWIINGTKQFITSGSTADVAIIFAVTDKSAGKNSITAFIVPTTTKGYIIGAKENKMGQHASDTCQIIFDDMQLTPDLMLGKLGQGYKIALSNLEGGRIGIAAQSVGMARAALDHAIDYANQRVTMGKTIINHQAVGFRLADMLSKLTAARLMTHNAASLRDAGKPAMIAASMAKLFASQMAEEVCSAAIQTYGGYGYLNDYPVERIARDVRVCQIYEGTSDIQRMVIARSLRS